MEEMENALKNALGKYKNKQKIFELLLTNNENDAQPFMEECLEKLCDDHTPESLLALAQFFMKVGDFRLACEVIWGSASLSIQEFIRDRQLNVKLYSHISKSRFTAALSIDLGNRFAVFETCHTSYYTNTHKRCDVDFAFNRAEEFMEQLRAFHLSDEKRIELEKRNFN
ncbi:hypothetical protein ACQ4LE_006519 [Meloidogyne hapla]